MSVDDIKRELVELPWWDMTIEVRSLTGGQRAKLFKNTADAKGQVDAEKLYPDLVIATSYDPETGKRIFEPADRDVLMTKNSAALDKLAKVAMRLSGIDQEAAEAAAKNSQTTPSEDSTSN